MFCCFRWFVSSQSSSITGDEKTGCDVKSYRLCYFDGFALPRAHNATSLTLYLLHSD